MNLRSKTVRILVLLVAVAVDGHPGVRAQQRAQGL